MTTFQTFFHGKLTGYHALCLKSFVDHGHSVVVYSYETEQVPKFCRAEPAEAIIQLDKMFFYNSGPGAGSVSCFSNLMRYEILHRNGGWWIDTDVLCLTPEWQDKAPISFGRESEGIINCAVMKFQAGQDALSAAAETCKQVGGDAKWGQTGPRLITELVNKHNLHEFVCPSGKYYPVHWQDWSKLIDPASYDAVVALTAGAECVHLWWEMFRRGGIGIDELPPAGSFLAEAVRRHDAQAFFRV